MVAKILVIDDDAHVLSLFESALKCEGRVMLANTADKAIKYLNSEEFALIFIDVKMPNIDGIKLAKITKKNKKNKFASIIFCSESNDNKAMYEAYGTGCIDFLIKPISTLVLKSKTHLFVEIVLRRKKMKRALLKLSNTDELTNIHNRRKFNDITNFEVSVVKRYKRPLTLIIIDIDDFKKINDTFGHPEGDKVLKELSLLMMRHKREPDILARYGGEEFALLCPETPVNDYNALTIGDRLRVIIENHTFNHRHKITVSLGATEFRRARDSFESFIDRADKALYKAKRNGKNRVEIIK